jgi:HYDIN/CFA65/VesB family protein/centrosomal CEP192-like protein/Ig-like domain-containing protein
MTRCHRLLILVAMLFVALVQSGCVSLAGNLTASQSNLSFGSVAIGSSSNQSLTLRNSGTAPFTITQAVASGRGFTVTGPPLPMTLAEGQSATFIARFAPSAIGEASGSLLLTQSQASTPQLTGGSGSATATIATDQKTIAMAGTGVPVAPSITTQPASQTVTVGQTATFSVTSSGAAPLSYQWSKNGAAISGATSSAYTTPATTSADSGSQFTVTVSNSNGKVTSSTATLTVQASGQLTASATNLNYGNITVGSSSLLSVSLTNKGASSVSISNVTLSGAGLSTGGVSSGLLIAPGSSAVLNLTFAPSATGTLNGSVTVASTATNPTVTISLSGTAVPPVSHSATLVLAPSSSNVAGYNVYRSSISNGPYTKLNSPPVTSTTYVDSTVAASQTYYYVATSVDSAGNESAYSNQMSTTIP